MTIKEAILKSLEDFPCGARYREVYQNIIDKGIFTFNKEAKTPCDTVSGTLSTMTKENDIRIKRFLNEDNYYCYYLSKYESYIENKPIKPSSNKINSASYNERDLHPILCKYLDYLGILPKTIYHEKSKKGEEHQKWVHPDIVGAQFIERKNKVSNSLFKALSKTTSLKLYSYELKKRIDNDYDLKKCFFQAVSNSSWANYGYLVAFEINESLKKELERLNNSFGIGFILLKAEPHESQIWFQAKDKNLDFSTIDKLCEINLDFKEFIKHVEATLTADEKHFESSKVSLQYFCDKFPKTEQEIIEYCNKHKIPIAVEDNN